jgi:hypothetical protein
MFRGAAFVCVVQVNVGLDVVAVGESIQLFFDDQTGSAIVAPTSLDDERIPNQDLLLIRAFSALEAPFQKFFVRPAFQGLCRQSIVVDLPEPAEAGIEARGIGKPQIVASGQQPLRIEAYFVQHAGKENDAGRFNVVAAGRLSIHVVFLLVIPPSRRRVVLSGCKSRA